MWMPEIHQQACIVLEVYIHVCMKMIVVIHKQDMIHTRHDTHKTWYTQDMIHKTWYTQDMIHKTWYTQDMTLFSNAVPIQLFQIRTLYWLPWYHRGYPLLCPWECHQQWSHHLWNQSVLLFHAHLGPQALSLLSHQLPMVWLLLHNNP